MSFLNLLTHPIVRLMEVDAVSSATTAWGHFFRWSLIWPAIIFCVVGVVWRMAMIYNAPPQIPTLKLFPAAKAPGLKALADSFCMPQIRKHKPLFWVFLMVFHIALILLLLGHLDILLKWNLMPQTPVFLYSWGLVGVATTLPLIYFLVRRMYGVVRAITVPADYLLLISIILLCLFGDLLTMHGIAHKLNPADPVFTLGSSYRYFLTVHVLIADLFLISLPFSKIAHAFFAMPINMLRRK